MTNKTVPYGEKKGRGQSVKGHWHGYWYPKVEKNIGRKRARRNAKEEIKKETIENET